MVSPSTARNAPRVPLPTAPVFGWSGALAASAAGTIAFDQQPHLALTSSGRAAAYWALKALSVQPGTGVLVPAYHCPTMVAPIRLLGLQPIYYEIGDSGLPELDGISLPDPKPAAMICAHYFGLPQSLQNVRAWCDRHGITLIEDCAHSFFGMAGERPVGRWGDFATASVTKFFPVPECGLLASMWDDRTLPHPSPQGLKAELKGVIDVLEISARHDRLYGLNSLVRLFGYIKSKGRGVVHQPSLPRMEQVFTAEELMRLSDMARIERAPLLISRLICRALARHRIVANRQRNFDIYRQRFPDAGVMLPQAIDLAGQCLAPYVFPLLVADADRVYMEIKRIGLPVFRWDRLWPGASDAYAPRSLHWSRHVLQLVCHQDLDAADVESTADAIYAMLNR